MTLKPYFDSPYQQYAIRNGHPFTVLGPISEEHIDMKALTPEENDLLRQQTVIQFEDGEKITAWPEEIYEDEHENMFGEAYSNAPD